MGDDGLLIDLPADVIALLGETPEAAVIKATRSVVLELLREGRISQGRAADVLGLTRHGIIDLMAEHDIPSGPRTLDEYEDEVDRADHVLSLHRA